ncbi:MAG: serine/threonine-protein kinase [Deltaproteobacteria bacterium]
MFLPTPGALVANRFRLRHAIGKGGMGQVWEAHDKELDGPCAVKFIVDHLAQDPEARLRMVREARAVARLRSPHVVSISSVGEHEGAMYLAMELLEGETLSNRLERSIKLDATTTLALLEQIVQVLDKAHASGIIHRDLKPDNIWLTAEPKLFVKVLDFGIVKSTFKMGGGDQTVSGALMGTPQYMSPEQANGEREVDHRCDLWALAIIAMECLSGRRPFESTGLGELLMKIMTKAPPPVHDLDPALPASLGPWWQRALARDPNQRFQNAADLVHGLRLGLATAVGRGPSVFDRTEQGSWLSPPAAPTPMRGQTLVTNIEPTPLSSPPPTPPLPLGLPPSSLPVEKTVRVDATPLRTPREPGTSVGPVTHTAELTRPPAPRRWLVYGAGCFALAVALLGVWRGVRSHAGGSDGLDIHWSTLRPLEPGTAQERDEPPAGTPLPLPSSDPLTAPDPPQLASPPGEAPALQDTPTPVAPADAPPLAAPPAAVTAPPKARTAAPKSGSKPRTRVVPPPRPPQRLTHAPPGIGPVLPTRPVPGPVSKPPSHTQAPTQDSQLKERLGF